jgi:high-affinity nickel-transport protein
MPPEVAAALGLIGTALALGIRHGFDWDHLAAITDVTSTTATADHAELHHETEHAGANRHEHSHGGPAEVQAHAGAADTSEHPHEAPKARLADEQKRAMLLGTLYALGHAAVVAVLGLLALLFGALLPDWVDTVMGPVVGATLVFLGIWVFVSLYQYARHGHQFRLRSRWMLVFDSVRYAWRRFQAWLHGHEHVDPMEMSSYGARTAFGVGMIHGVGAETITQVVFIGTVAAAADAGVGVPALLAFIVGLLISNSIVVLITATGFIASRLRERLYVAIGVVAGAFSLVIGTIFLLGLDAQLPSLEMWLFWSGS